MKVIKILSNFVHSGIAYILIKISKNNQLTYQIHYSQGVNR